MCVLLRTAWGLGVGRLLVLVLEWGPQEGAVVLLQDRGQAQCPNPPSLAGPGAPLLQDGGGEKGATTRDCLGPQQLGCGVQWAGGQVQMVRWAWLHVRGRSGSGRQRAWGCEEGPRAPADS